MPRELVTIGDIGTLWDTRTRAAVARHPVMWGLRPRAVGALAQPVFFGTLPAALEDTAAALYHRLLSGGCTTAAFPEASAFQTQYNAAGSGSTLVVDGKYGQDSAAGLQFVLTAASGQGGSADGLFNAPPSCFPTSTATPTPSTSPVVTPAAIVVTSASSPMSGFAKALIAAGVGAAAYVGYRTYKKKRHANPCSRMCARR